MICNSLVICVFVWAVSYQDSFIFVNISGQAINHINFVYKHVRKRQTNISARSSELHWTIFSTKKFRRKMKCVLGILVVCIVHQISARSVDFQEAPIKTVAIIGAGTAGLASAKYSLAQGYDVTIYEQNEQLGGIWWYTDHTGINQYGIEIHSPMYQNLRCVTKNIRFKKLQFFLKFRTLILAQ